MVFVFYKRFIILHGHSKVAKKRNFINYLKLFLLLFELNNVNLQIPNIIWFLKLSSVTHTHVFNKTGPKYLNKINGEKIKYPLCIKYVMERWLESNKIQIIMKCHLIYRTIIIYPNSLGYLKHPRNFCTLCIFV